MFKMLSVKFGPEKEPKPTAGWAEVYLVVVFTVLLSVLGSLIMFAKYGEAAK